MALRTCRVAALADQTDFVPHGRRPPVIRQVPEDPGITELADFVEAAAAHVSALPGDPGSVPRTFLGGAVEDLRAAARLGSLLLPAVTLRRLQRAIDLEYTAHQRHTRSPHHDE
ncbi:hypothetical protein [Streptomyces sp. NPDC058542]|uniref:hypothetical protein n=1 Tax=Streptomyces sp. NPDC058542 TaxID=3346543 RepID=UPI003653D386